MIQIKWLQTAAIGQVTATREEGDECAIDVAVRAANDLGDHATGTVTVTLPIS